MEILDYSQWYVKSGKFDPDRVLKGCVDKEKKALKKGFDGLRCTGNTFWLMKKDWAAFRDYENKVNRVIGDHQMIAICTYSLDRCDADENLDVVSNHQYALIRRTGKWEIIESFEREKAREKIRESEEKYRNLFEMAPDAIMTLDIDGVITSWNTVAETLTGYSAVEMIGKHFSELKTMRAEHASKYLKMFEYLSRGKIPAPFEATMLNKNGEPHLVDVRVSLIKKDNKPIGLMVISRDVTEQKKAEEALNKSEEKFRLLLKNLNDALYVPEISPRKGSGSAGIEIVFKIKTVEKVCFSMLIVFL